MNDHRGSDLPGGAPFKDGADESWEESELLGGFAEDLRNTYIHPIDVATRSQHLAAIARARNDDPARFTPAVTQRLLSERGWCAPGFRDAAGPVRRSSAPSPGLGSPFSRPAPPPPRADRPALAPAVADIRAARPETASKRRHAPLAGSVLSKAAALAAVFAIGASGLAFTGGLPNRVQTAFSQASEAIGLDLPAPKPLPGQSTDAPVREQTVPMPQPSPTAEASAPASQSALQPPPTSSAVAPPQPPAGDLQAPKAPTVSPNGQPNSFESWLAELIRQAIEAASTGSGTRPQPTPTTQPEGSGQTQGRWGEMQQDRETWSHTERSGSTSSGSRSNRQR